MKRNKAVDALRGIAALSVLVLHVGTIFLTIPDIKSQGDGLLHFLAVIDLGRIGITIFFLISGFVICKSINGSVRFPVRHFFIKRIFRLYPLFWFSVIAGLLFIWYANGWPVTTTLVLANLTMIPAFFGEEFIIGLYWTLETELIFYVLVAILFKMGYLKNTSILLGFIILLYGALWLFNFSSLFPISLAHWKSTPYHLSLMFYGVIFRYHFDALHKSSDRIDAFLSIRNVMTLATLIIFAVPIIVFFKYGFNASTEYVSDATAYVIGIAVFSAGLYFWSRPRRSMVNLGTISYSIYLMHPVVFYIVLRLVEHYEVLRHGHISIYILVCSLLTIAVSHFTYILIERPFNRFGHEKANDMA